MLAQWRLIVVPIAATVVAACSFTDPTVEPSEFVAAHAHDAQEVLDAVKQVDAGGTVLKDSGEFGIDATSAFAGFDAVLSKAQATFDSVNHTLLMAPKPKGLESSLTEMWSATDELSQAMKSGRAYVDDQKPSQLADWRKHWDTGRGWWNQAVTPIWQAAHQTPPTIEDAPTAPPAS
jgi:hypothetical protein